MSRFYYNLKCFLFLSSVLVLFGKCDSKRVVSISELKAYVNTPENGLVQSTSSGNFKFEAIYRPKDLILKQQLEGVTSETERNGFKKQLDSLEYFVIHLSNNGHEIENDFVSNPSELSAITEYLSVGILDDLLIVNEGKLIKPIDIAYTRSYGASTATSVMAIFKSDVKSQADNITLRFHDSQLGTGMHDFVFRASDIQNIPTLNLD